MRQATKHFTHSESTQQRYYVEEITTVLHLEHSEIEVPWWSMGDMLAWHAINLGSIPGWGQKVTRMITQMIQARSNYVKT